MLVCLHLSSWLLIKKTLEKFDYLEIYDKKIMYKLYENAAAVHSW